MFQIAATTSLAKDLGNDAVFDFDACHTPKQGLPSNRYKNSIFRNVFSKNLSGHTFRLIHDEPKFSYSDLPRQDNLLLNGYFQSERYFEKHRDQIVALFQPDEPTLKEVRAYLDGVVGDNTSVTAVHIRRGDYLNSPDRHPILSTGYYRDAMHQIGQGHFVFVSDDMNWCKKNFQGENIHYSPFMDELNDLALIAACDHQIIANSSFSWWGAYLCTSENNKVLAPKAWFGPKGPKDTDDLIPSDWMTI